jgi:prealbumin domain-containing protein
MRYPRKFVRRVGLLSSLLFVGVLGGLLAPLSSEAVPTLTLKVDSGTASSILITTSSTCTATEVTLGYTACYAINTNLTVNGAGAAVNRSYNVRNAPGATARLRVADKLGQDKFSLIGVQFIPAVTNWGSANANANETHVLTLAMSNPFNSAVNLNNTGTYVWALRAGGEFRAGPTTAGACTGFTTTGVCNNLQNKVTFPGTGIFNPAIGSKAILSPAGSAANTQPLSFTVAGPTALGQVNPTYPSFSCDNNGTTAGGACTPTITETMTVTLKGPDSFVLVNGGDAFAANCTAELSNKQERQIAFLTNLVRFLQVLEQRRPNPRLSAFIDKLEAFLATVNRNQDPNCPGATLVDLDIAVAAAADQVAFLADGAVVGEPAPPDTGTITINKNVCTEESCTGLAPVQFTFSINTGDNPPIVANVTTDGTGHGTTGVSVPAGTYNVVESPQSGWNLIQASCGGGNTNGVTVLVGGNVTCNFTNSPATANDLGIRLTWGAQPSDLDSHLYIPNGYEVAYFAQGSLENSPYADLDLDDTTGFGPENITVVRRMKGTYQYFVHNYSETFSPGMTGSPARVELIRNGVTTTYVPPSDEGTNRYWHVFNVIVNSDCVVSIVPINAWLTSPPSPVTQTEALCPVVP